MFNYLETLFLTGFGYLLTGLPKVFFVSSVISLFIWLLIRKISPWMDHRWPEKVDEDLNQFQSTDINVDSTIKTNDSKESIS
jgi:hypothetical protein